MERIFVKGNFLQWTHIHDYISIKIKKIKKSTINATEILKPKPYESTVKILPAYVAMIADCHFLMFVLLLLPMIIFSPHLLMDSKSYMDTHPYFNPPTGFQTYFLLPVMLARSASLPVHCPIVCCTFSFFSPLLALWKANEESWAEGSFCVLVKKNNLCQRKVLQQLCCRTCSLNGWRNHYGPTCRWRSANLYYQPRTSNRELCWEVSRCQNYNKPTFTCVYGFGRTCQGVATGINNKQLIIWFSILWPKHGCQIFVTFCFLFGSRDKFGEAHWLN